MNPHTRARNYKARATMPQWELYIKSRFLGAGTIFSCLPCSTFFRFQARCPVGKNTVHMAHFAPVTDNTRKHMSETTSQGEAMIYPAS